MKTEDILNLDFRKEENQEIMQKVLRKIKPLSKFSEDERIPIEAIEKVIGLMVRKYSIRPQFMMLSYGEQANNIYSCGVKTDDTHTWLGDVHGITLYEIFSKMAVKIYSEVKSGNIPLRTLTKEEKQRERIARNVDEGNKEERD